jgi:hypothetical protein
VAPGPGGGPAPVDAAPSQSRPTREEVIDYLDGKELDLAMGGDGGQGKAKHVIRKEQIEALQVADSATSVNDEPWSVQIDFILNSGMGRYAVTGRVEHKLVDHKRAFFGFSVERVARQ